MARQDDTRFSTERPPPGFADTLRASLRRVVEEILELLLDEVKRTGLGIVREVHRVQRHLAAFLAGALLLFCAFLFVLVGITLGLAEAMPAWLAAFLVAAIAAGGGVLLIRFARQAPLSPAWYAVLRPPVATSRAGKKTAPITVDLAQPFPD